MAVAAVLCLSSVPRVEAAPLPKGKSVAVVIYEQASNLLHRGSALGTAESLVKQTLIRNGYPVVNEQRLAAIRKSKAAALALEGNVNAIMQLGSRYGVRIFVSGRASVSQPRKNQLGFYTGTAAISVQAHSAANGKYLFSDTVTGKDTGYTAGEASQKALMAAARAMGRNLVQGEGTNTGGGGTGQPVTAAQNLSLEVQNIYSYTAANGILRACQSLVRTQKATMTGFSGGKVVIQVLYRSTARDLADALSRRGLQINITGVAGNRVMARGY
ncbi:MAG: hypothetical protein K9L28_09850 [Synergistales bacterium]|nr:hypothetical protein [Synergistales bacterium]